MQCRFSEVNNINNTESNVHDSYKNTTYLFQTIKLATLLLRKRTPLLFNHQGRNIWLSENVVSCFHP